MIPIPDFTEQELQEAHANYLKEMLENENKGCIADKETEKLRQFKLKKHHENNR